MNNRILWFVLCFASGVFTAKSQEVIPAVPETDHRYDFVEDNFIVAALDSLSNEKYFESSENVRTQMTNNKYNFLPDFVPSYTDSIYYYRMQKLDVESPIELTYNSYVRSFIDLYANRRRGTMSRVLGLSQMYFPMIEQQLDKYNLPLELKYLAIVESALNPKARSRVGAGGLWQFMYYTGKTYGLEVNSLVDDRNDPLKATIAACKHFQDLYNMYHDWCLVLAAYNSGAGNVNKAIRRSGGRMTFWEIMPFLPRETRDYVPAFIAVNYVMKYSQEHNLYPIMPKMLYYQTDTVAVTQPLSFAVLAEKLNLSNTDLEFLNPTFRKDFIPATPFEPIYIRLPSASIGNFITNESALYAYNQLKGYDASRFASTQDDTEYQIVTKKITHKVRKGETLASIARRYDCSASELKRWNKLRHTNVHRGQSLRVFVQVRRPVRSHTPVENSDQQTATTQTEYQTSSQETVVEQETTSNEPEVRTVNQQVKNKPKYHKVRRGETLGSIATRYRVSARSLMAWNHLRKKQVNVGQTLRVNAPYRTVASRDKRETEDTYSESQDNDNSNESTQPQFHKVRRGETLSKIASRYHVSTADLTAWNNLNHSKVVVGQSIRLTSPEGDNASGKHIRGKSSEENDDAQYAEESSPKTAARFHTVRKGEFLAKIAAKYHVSVDDLLAWNKLESPKVHVGQKLRVSPAGSTANKARSKEAEGNNKKLVYYTVKPGDTLWSISQKYDGVTAEQIKQWNRLKGNSLKVGQKLKVLLPPV